MYCVLSLSSVAEAQRWPFSLYFILSGRIFSSSFSTFPSFFTHWLCGDEGATVTSSNAIWHKLYNRIVIEKANETLHDASPAITFWPTGQ